jgi:hypothetical protein
VAHWPDKDSTGLFIHVEWESFGFNSRVAGFQQLPLKCPKLVPFDRPANMTDTFGNRMVGSDRLEHAIDYNVNQLKHQQFDNVHTEDVPGLPNWKRGEEYAMLLGKCVQ